MITNGAAAVSKQFKYEKGNIMEGSKNILTISLNPL